MLRECAQRLAETADYIRSTNWIAKLIVNLIRTVDALIVSLPTGAREESGQRRNRNP